MLPFVHQNTQQTLAQHRLPVDPRVGFDEQTFTILFAPGRLHQLVHAARVELHVRGEVVDFALPDTPCIFAFAAVLLSQPRRRDAEEVTRDGLTTEVGGRGRVLG